MPSFSLSSSHANVVSVNENEPEAKDATNSLDCGSSSENDFCFSSASNLNSTTIPYHECPAPIIESPSVALNMTKIGTSNNISHGTKSNFGVANDASIVFFIGFAAIWGLIVLVFISVVLFDHYFGYKYRQSEQRNRDEQGNADGEHGLVSPNTYGPVAFKAKLWGLTAFERKDVLEKVFESNTITYSTRTINQERSGSQILSRAQHQLFSHEDSSLSSADSVDEASQESCDSVRADEESGADSDSDPHRNAHILCSSKGKTNKDDQKGKTIVDFSEFNDTCMDKTCAICLGEYGMFISALSSMFKTLYNVCLAHSNPFNIHILLSIEENDKLLFARHCSHLYHYDCIMQWMEKQHDNCPCCRVEMMTPHEMHCAASKVCGSQRMKELSAVAIGGALRHEADDSEPATVSAHSAEFAEDVLRNIIEALDHLVAL